jgi:predicted esterase
MPSAELLYAELYKIESLYRAYCHLKDESRSSRCNTLPFGDVERNKEEFFRRLSGDLRARTYQPGSYHSEFCACRDQIVQVLLKGLLSPLFQPELPCEPRLEDAIKWVAGVVEGGLTRVYAVNLEECFDSRRQELLMNSVNQRVGDPDVVGLLQKVLATSGQDYFRRSLLTSVACDGIDRMLQQAKAIGRDGVVSHVKCARFANELIVLLDNDPHYDWLLPAVYRRLSEELAKIKSDMGEAEVQSVNLADGGKLLFLGFELQSSTDRSGRLHASYKRLGAVNSNEGQLLLPRLQIPEECVDEEERATEVLEDSVAARPSRFRWRRCIPSLGPLLMVWRRLESTKLRWHYLMNVLPIVLFLGMVFVYGWLSPITLACAALIPICNFRSVWAGLKFARRRPLDATGAACGIAVLVWLLVLGNDIYSHMPREAPLPKFPAGFYLGEYKGGFWDELAPIEYGLYVPPHLKNEKGPFPLIVFMHGGYREKTRERAFSDGMPQAIKSWIRRGYKPDYVAFFPIDPTGKWSAGSSEMEDAMKPLDYVIQHYNIDPKRVYLTGISNGASGAWRQVEAQPNRWAAIAAFSTFYCPDVETVRGIPAYIFHGAKDRSARVEPVRTFVQKLQTAGADVTYEEFPTMGHDTWTRVYSSHEFFDKLLRRRKE